MSSRTSLCPQFLVRANPVISHPDDLDVEDEEDSQMPPAPPVQTTTVNGEQAA